MSNQADVIIIGGGVAGLVTALELLESPLKILMLDRDVPENFGGLAKESFGGITMVGTPHQRLTGIKDSADLALRDWANTAEFGPGDEWPRRWMDHYVNESLPGIYRWLTDHSVRFFPVVHWVERGLYTPGNSVPRFHMVWGTGRGLIEALLKHLEKHPHRQNLEIKFRHKVSGIDFQNGKVQGCSGVDEITGKTFLAQAPVVVVAAGGISGSHEKVRATWYRPWGSPPKTLLNGSHRYADGTLHGAAEKVGAHITHLDKQWNYAAGVHHPSPNKPDHGLSLVPPKSALWFDATGKRFGPEPLTTAYCTRHIVEQVCLSEHKYSWQILNRKIALKELAVSGSEFNDAIRDKKFFGFLATILFGNHKLYNTMVEKCPDFVVANTLEELVSKMNALDRNGPQVSFETVKNEIKNYDAMIDRGEKFFNDDQLRRIAHLRKYPGDKLRTCKFQKIIDKRALPLIAIREFILTRKTLGGIQTNLESQALNQQGQTMSGLYAVGEAAGFGGGGIHGLRSLEGTFLGSCVLTARAAAKSILSKGRSP